MVLKKANEVGKLMMNTEREGGRLGEVAVCEEERAK